VQFCRRSNVVFDVGANVGLYSLAGSAANPKADVFAFEPLDYWHTMLRRNAELNPFPRLHCERLALGNKIGSADVPVSPLSSVVHRSHGGSARLMTSNSLSPRYEKQTVPVTTIARFARNAGLKSIDLLKIDVESAEPEVLDGMEDLLYRMRPSMIVEVLTDEVGARLERMLSPVYLYFQIDEHAGLTQTHRIQRFSETSKNYFFYAADKAEEILPLLNEI